MVLTAVSCEEFGGLEAPTDEIYFPAGMAIHSTGDYLYVVNTNFDVRYGVERGGTVVVVDTNTLQILPESTVKIGSFAGRVVLSENERHLYIAVRGDNSVTQLEVSEDGRSLSCLGGNDGLRCRYQNLTEDPYAVAVESHNMNLAIGGETDVDLILVTHLVSNSVTAISLKDLDPTTQVRLDEDLTAGGSAMARHPRTGYYYLTGRFDSHVRIFWPYIGWEGEITGLFMLGSIPIRNPAGDYDARDIDFSTDGNRAYVSARRPGAILVLDTSPSDPLTGGGSRDEFIGQIDLDNGPEELVVIEEEGQDNLYIAEYGSDSVTVVDPVNEIVVDRIRVGNGPTAFAVDQVRHNRLYVSLFNEDAVGVVDIDPESRRYRMTVAKIR